MVQTISFPSYCILILPYLHEEDSQWKKKFANTCKSFVLEHSTSDEKKYNLLS